MPKFRCQVCQSIFEVPQAALDKYPGWKPKYCREHSPNKGKAAADAKGSSAKRGSKASKKPRGKRRSVTREENLTLAEVLERYTDGPESGVFTDGGAVPNPGPGGWGAVWVENGEIRAELHGHDSDTTNNRMELTALLEAFKALPEEAAVTIHSDSRLCVDTITKWAPGWERNGWKRKGDPLKNLDLVKPLLAAYRAHPNCKLEWIAAHNGYRWNEYADSLASAWRREEV